MTYYSKECAYLSMDEFEPHERLTKILFIKSMMKTEIIYLKNSFYIPLRTTNYSQLCVKKIKTIITDQKLINY